MIKGLYSAASAMLAGLNLQGILAHNVANMDTPGFKQVMVSLDDYIQTPVTTGGLGQGLRSRLAGQLGLGVETLPEEIDFGAGSLLNTTNPFDFAIQGPGFFRVRTPDGERYTRDGRFLLDASNQLVTIDGYLVLSNDGQPITLQAEGPVTVSGDGTLYVDGQAAGQIGLAAFENPAAELTRSLPNTFEASGQPTGQELGSIMQGYVESANVNPAQLMTQMVQVARSYEAAQQMVQNEDALLGQAISTLGRL